MLYTPARHSQTPSKTCLWLSNCQSRSHHSHLGTHIQPCLQMAWGPSETKKKKNHLNEYTRVTFKTKSYKILHIYKTLCVTAVLDRDALIAFYFVTNWHPISPVNNSQSTNSQKVWHVSRHADKWHKWVLNFSYVELRSTWARGVLYWIWNRYPWYPCWTSASNEQMYTFTSAAAFPGLTNMLHAVCRINISIIKAQQAQSINWSLNLQFLQCRASIL